MDTPIPAAVNLAEIAFECISGPYHRGNYGGLEVIINVETGYINATHLYGQALTKGGKKKVLYDWSRGASAAALIAELSASLGIPGDMLLVTPPGLPNELRGQYAHPDLIPHIACDASPKFAVKVSRIVNAHVVRDYKRSIAAKDEKIDELSAKIDALLADNKLAREERAAILANDERLRNENQAVLDLLEMIGADATATHERLDATSAQLAVANTNIAAIGARLNVAVVDRVPPTNNASFAEVFVLLNRPTTRDYRVVRSQARSIKTAEARHRSNGFSRRVCRVGSPNAVNLWRRIRDGLPLNLGAVSRCGYFITLAAGATETELLAFVRTVEAQKRAV